MFEFLTLVCILGSFISSNAADLKLSCPTNISSDSPPPVVISSAYYYKVAISVKSKNETLEASEHYDMDRGMVEMIVHFTDADNSSIWKSEWIQYDYNYNQTFTVDLDNKTCLVDDLMHNETVSIFGVGVENGFKNIRYPFYWNGNYNYTQKNDTYVNGVPANVYSTCLLFDDSMKYDVDLYFSSEEWITRAGSSIPLMLVIKSNQTLDGKNFISDEHTYSFSSYSHDTSTHQKLQPGISMWNLRCDGRKDEKPLPEMWSTYGLTEEMFDSHKKRILSARKFYNYEDKLARADFIVPNNSRFATQSQLNHHLTMIQDFHAGVQYWIDRETGNCTVQNLNYSMILFDIQADPQHTGYLMMSDHAKILRKQNYTYTGRHILNQMTVESWTSTVPLKWNGTRNGVFHEVEMHETLIYTTPDWSNADVSPVLVGEQYHIKNTTNGTTTMRDVMLHVSDHSPMLHGGHVFDVSRCYANEETYTAVIKFSGDYGKYIRENSEAMKAALRTAVSEAAEVRQLRVSGLIGMEVAADHENEAADRSLFVSVTILDTLDFHGNTTEYRAGINLTEAVTNLQNIVASNMLLVEFKLRSGEKVRMTAFSEYFKEKGSLFSPSSTPPSPGPGPAPAVTAGVSKGAAAGIAVGMIVVGFILGALVLHFRNRRGNRQFGYSIQD